jgi:hypothetical protein
MATEEKTNDPKVEEILRNAEALLAKITQLAEEAKAAAAATGTIRDAAAESQKLISTVVTDAQAKLTEIATAVGQATITASTIRDGVEESKDLVKAVVADANTTLSQLKTSATQAADAAGTARDASKDYQKQITAILDDAKAKFAEVTAAATQVVATQAKITDAQAVIATKSAHINDAQKHADEVRADLDRQLTAAKGQVTAAEAEKAKAQASAVTAANLLKDVQTAKASGEADAEKIAAALKTAQESSIKTKGLADKSVEVEKRITDYEGKLLELEMDCGSQLKAIEGLLPGATAAGLANSWDERRKTFLKPHNRWQWLFVGSLLAIVALAGSGLLQVLLANQVPPYDELFRLWLVRLPIAGALIWLALHASHEAALAKRLEEDYGYKATVASCLMGFQKQISEVGKDAAANPSLTKLLDNTLTTIASPPGRIYDKHKLTVSPSGELTEAAKAAAEVAAAASLIPKVKSEPE